MVAGLNGKTKCFILGGSRAEQLCLKSERFSSRIRAGIPSIAMPTGGTGKLSWRDCQLAISILLLFVACECYFFFSLCLADRSEE